MKRYAFGGALVLLLAAVLLFNLSFWMSADLQEEGDLAANALQIERAGEFKELLGPYSHYGFHHPGPVSFYYFAFTEPIFRWIPSFLGRHMLAQYLLNLLWVFGLVRMLRQGGLGSTGATAAGVLVMAQLVFLGGGTPIMAASVWGPAIAAVPAAVFVVAAALMAGGRLTALPWMVAAGTVCAHNHLSQGSILFWITLAAGGWLAVRRRHVAWTPAPGRRRRILILSALLLVPALFPVGLEQATGDPGNLSLIVRFLQTHGPEVHPWSEVADKLGQAVTDPWAVMLPAAAGLIHTPGGVVGIVLVLLAGSALQFRRSDAAWRRVIVFLWLAVTVTVVSARTATGDLHTYLFYLLYPVGGLLYLILFKEIIDRTTRRFAAPPAFRSRLSVVLAALVFFVPWLATHRIAPPPPGDRFLDIVDHFDLNPRDDIHLHLDRGSEMVIWDAVPTLALRFRREGARVSVPDDYLFICGTEMKATLTPHPRTLLVTGRRPAGDDPRFWSGDRWNVFLLTPADGTAADFLDALPATD